MVVYINRDGHPPLTNDPLKANAPRAQGVPQGEGAPTNTFLGDDCEYGGGGGYIVQQGLAGVVSPLLQPLRQLPHVPLAREVRALH